MHINELPKWMRIIPTLLGVALAFAGMYALPSYGIRNTWGPIVGLPLGFVAGLAALSAVASRRREPK